MRSFSRECPPRLGKTVEAVDRTTGGCLKSKSQQPQVSNVLVFNRLENPKRESSATTQDPSADQRTLRRSSPPGSSRFSGRGRPVSINHAEAQNDGCTGVPFSHQLHRLPGLPWFLLGGCEAGNGPVVNGWLGDY